MDNACWPLIGYKAILVGRSERVPRIHDIKKLNEITKIDLPKKYLPILDIFTECISWNSKYPVPFDEKNFRKGAEIQKKYLAKVVKYIGKTPIIQDNGLLCWESFDEIWKILAGQYFKEDKTEM
jgi:hypothetical protein